MLLCSLQIFCEVPGGSNWNFDIHWYPSMPGIISASSFDGKIGLYNIEVKIIVLGHNPFILIIMAH